ncbi:MAG: NUDIX domain-containing protein [Gammaproteobacteria bacterium]|nr:NUDIX domain-containing protein [Gammaproteobacteria bacterium]
MSTFDTIVVGARFQPPQRAHLEAIEQSLPQAHRVIVVWHDEVLWIRCGRLPGKGLWALPGRFIEPGEILVCAVVRELREETGLALEESAAREHRVFDAPERSLRGRTITHVLRFDIDASETPPAVAGGDDARSARYTPRPELEGASMFEDHYAILQVTLDLD